MAILAGHRCRIFLNGADISGLVHKCDVSFAVNEVVTTTLTLFDSPRIDADGTIRLGLDGPIPSVAMVSHALPVDAAGRPFRAILLRRDDHED